MRIPCIHGRERYYCRDCGGLSFCIHNKNKKFCKECHGSGICIHDRQKHHCKDCDVKGLLEKNRKKQLCIHGKRKYYCRDCGGGGFCVHSRYKSQCKECKIVSKEKKFYTILSKCDETNEVGRYITKPIINYLKKDDEDVCVHGNNKDCSECFVSSLLK